MSRVFLYFFFSKKNLDEETKESHSREASEEHDSHKRSNKKKKVNDAGNANDLINSYLKRLM